MRNFIMNLFQKYGGSSFWSEFLNIYMQEFICSESLSHYCEEVGIDHIRRMAEALMEVTFSSERKYPKDVLKGIHKNLGITNADFGEWIKIYRVVLKEIGISDEDLESIMINIETYRNTIVSKS